MRILLTADCLGGVGVFAAELAAGLRERGHAVAVAALGGADWPFRLEWMDSGAIPAADCAAARAQLAAHARAFRADLLHSNHFACVGAADGIPTLLGVHSDVVSWWREVTGGEPPDTDFQRWYRGLALAALRRADAVVAPTHACARDLSRSFGHPPVPVAVIANGCEAAQFIPGPKTPLAVAVGRAADPAKQMPWLAGLGVTILDGTRPRAEVAATLARASVYVSASRYEPFGLAGLEAALSGCLLLLNDIPSQREVWGATATFFQRNRRADLARRLRELLAAPPPPPSPPARERALARYGRYGMVLAYERLYGTLLRRRRARATGPAMLPP